MNIPIWTALIPALIILVFIAIGYQVQKRQIRAVAAHKYYTEQNVMAMSHILLSTLAEQVSLAHKELEFLRDDRFTVDHDRGLAHAVAHIFTGWYNLAVASAINLSPVFEDIMVTKVDRQDTDDGTWLLIHLGQGNDVVKHFLPDRGLQSFITGVRAISSYMQIGANIVKQ